MVIKHKSEQTDPKNLESVLQHVWGSVAFMAAVNHQSHYAAFSSVASSGKCVGPSQLGSRGLIQHSPHVQQCVCHGLGQAGRTRLFAGVERRYSKVDVLIHWIVAHSISVWHNRAKTHDTVGLGWYLEKK